MRNDAATVLLTLGRLPVALEIARAFYGCGYRVIVAEPFAWPLCRLSKHVHKCFKVTAPVNDVTAYESELLSIIADEKVSLVIPVSEESLFVAALQDRLPTTTRLACMDQSCLLQLHDKFQFATWAQANALPVPQTVLANEQAALQALLSSDYVLKPRLSCSGAGVRFGHANEPLQTDECTARNLIQKKLTGRSCSTFTIASKGKTLIAVCYRSLLQSGTVSVCFEQMAMPSQITEFVSRAVSLLNYSGMISFDFIQDVNGQWQAIECNPRATSGIHFVDANDIVAAMSTHSIEQDASLHSDQSRRQEFWSCLTRVEGDMLKFEWNAQAWRHLFTTRDITWSGKDMKPFIFMPVVLAPQLWKAIRNKQPVSELLMLDVGWYQ